MPGVAFTHVIQTRFNMPSPGRESQIRNRPGWLAGRFDLFERYCLPSIAAQTERDFHWVIYLDVATPPEFRDRIEACRRIMPFTPFYTDYFDAPGWPRSLESLFPERTPWLLTSRLDSDDALAVDYVARLRAAVAAAQPTAACAFNVTEGIVIHAGRVYAHRHRSNAFASWFEPWDGSARTAMAIKHMELSKVGPILQVAGPAGWLQVIHDSNVSNKVRGRRVAPSILDGRFPKAVVGPLRPAGRTEIALENLVLTPLRSNRDALINHLRGYGRVSG